ncbi:MAG: sigma-70 family RNA polymerase sigma factor [Planctomycetes bacterium]|nr:sigma-70 family RNA polymerase sigma factor [Planctomycetota bacterium]
MDDTFPDHIALLRAACAGDCAAQDQLVLRFRGPLLERIRIMLGPDARRSAESSDFVQGVFVDVLRDLGRLGSVDERSFLRWATRIARNNILDATRRRHERALSAFASSFDVAGEGGAASPVDAAAHREQIERLVDALTALRPDDRAVLELRHFEGLGFAEIGSRMGRSENAVQLLHTRALIRLGALLRDG